MAYQIRVSARHWTGIYDAGAGVYCVTEKVVDITDDCHCPNIGKYEKIRLLFTRTQRGRIVKMVSGSKRIFKGLNVHFFIDELDEQFNVSEADDVFGRQAKIIGLEKLELRELIELHAPAR